MRSFCYKRALRVVRCPVAADEAAQEAVLRAWRHRERCNQPEQPFGWLGQIAHNEALRVAARRPNEVLVDQPFASARTPAPEDEPEVRLLIAGAIATLSSADQELARLRYFEDLTCATLAEHLGISEATVKVRLHRLRLKLRLRLEDEI